MTPLLTWIVGLIGRMQKPSKSQAPALAEVMVTDTQSFPETLARIAEGEVGVREVGGNNKGPRVQAYQAATWLAGTGWAWCAAFVCWVVYQAIQIHGQPKGWKRPRTAGAYDLENWGNGLSPHPVNGSWQVFKSTPQRPPQRGDIVTFTWSHTGFVTGYDAKTLTVFTVEGNAGAARTSDTPTGDGVVAKKQHVASIRRIIRYTAAA